MTKTLIVLDDLYTLTDSTITKASELKTQDDTIFFITNRDVTTDNVLPLTNNTIKDFLSLREEVETKELTFVVTPNQYAFVKFLATKVFGDEYQIQFEYVAVGLKGYEYTESINQYVEQMVTYIQKLDSVDNGNVKQLINAA